MTDSAGNSPQTASLTGTGASTAGGTYQIGVTGSAGDLAQSGAVTLVVQ